MTETERQGMQKRERLCLWRMNSKDRGATSVNKWCVAGGVPKMASQRSRNSLVLSAGPDQQCRENVLLSLGMSTWVN